MSHNSSDFYNGYDYSGFWHGREYEDIADKIAVSRLLSLIKNNRGTFVDLGVGTGRMISLYERLWKNFVLIDPSPEQLNDAQKKIFNNKNVKVIIGSTENIPVPPESCDTILCTRVFHHIAHPDWAIKEIHRVLKLRGYLVLEIPNKLHFKNRVKSFFKRDKNFFSDDEISIAVRDRDTTFVNHNPRTIRRLLESHGVQVVEILSVSNFRSAFFKKILPLAVLIGLEKILQKQLAYFWFGPSIYFLAQKIF